MARKKMTAKQKKRLKQVGWVTFGAGVIIVARELYLAGGPRRERRRITYEEAKQRSVTTGKPLIVLGDPDAGFLNRALGRSWQCGNLTIDPRGASACDGPAEGSEQGQPEALLAHLQSNSAVIYDSGLFAKTSDPYELAAQMTRVSGGDVFMADAGPWTLAAFFESGRKRRLYALPPTDGTLDWKPLPWHKKADTGQTEFATRGLGSGGRPLGTLVMEYYQ